FAVRPFQWKGIASNERNFEKDALNFHFGIEAAELFFEEDPMNPGEIIITETDNDGDGVHNEIAPGNVSAISAFTLAIRPPNELTPEGMEAQVARGRAIFTGEATDVVPVETQNCATCHTPSLRVNSSQAIIIDPTDISNLERRVGSTVGLSTQRESSRELPIVRRFENIMRGLEPSAFRSPAAFADAYRGAVARGEGQLVGYTFDLTDMDSLPLSFPRLPENMDGTIDVPLFSDLRRHDMGEGL